MYVRPAAPRSIGGVLDDAVSLYRQAYAKVAPLTAAAALIAAVPGLFLGLRMMRAQTGGIPAMLAVFKSPSYWFTYLLILIFHTAVYGALLAALESYIERNELSVGDALATSVSLLPRLLGVALLLAIAVMVGFMLLIIPGIYLSGIYQLALVAVIVERTGVADSFGVSKGLIKGHWWRSVTIVTVGLVIMFVFSLLAGVVNSVVARAVGFGATGLLLGQSVMSLLINVFLMPLIPCFLLCMYHDLKLRHEGADLAARVDALAAR